ncbi:hypothetical protein BU17DRAFT_65254 [Hysterangium stoloniferum]|nr:hypothetical protein BU17DRAFT_65254 [Hysterangium stoloniferum]
MSRKILPVLTLTYGALASSELLWFAPKDIVILSDNGGMEHICPVHEHILEHALGTASSSSVYNAHRGQRVNENGAESDNVDECMPVCSPGREIHESLFSPLSSRLELPTRISASSLGFGANHVLDDRIVAVRKTLLRFLTMVPWNTSVPFVETSHVPWSRALPLLKIDARYYIKLAQLRVLVAGAMAWTTAQSYFKSRTATGKHSSKPSDSIPFSLAAWPAAKEKADFCDGDSDHQPVERAFGAASMTMERASNGQIPHTAIVLPSEFDECDERSHHLPTNTRTEFAAVLGYITVCTYTMTSVQRMSAWRCTMERASRKQCLSALRKRDVDNTATAFAGNYSKAGIKAELASVDVHRTGCRRGFTGATARIHY